MPMAGITSRLWTENPRKSIWPYFLRPDQLQPGGARLDPTQFRVEDAVVVTVGVAGAAQGATSIPVAALSGSIPAGSILRFSADEYARTTALAAAGATSLAVEALVNALESGDVAIYGGAGTAKKVVPAGTLVGRTRTERDAGTGYGPWTAGDEDFGLTYVELDDVDANPDVVIVIPNRGTPVRENFLPGWATAASDYRAAVRGAYYCTVGVS